MKKILLIVLLLAGCGVGRLLAQVTLQVVSKNLEKTVPWKPGMDLIVNGEKADVTVVPTDSAAISISAELSAKHPSLDTAQADVNTWQLVVNTVGKKIYIRAYVGVQAGKRAPVSNMRAQIKIMAPRQCAVNLSNRFGKARLEHLDGPVALNGYFCRFDLFALNGELKVESEHGSVDGKELKGPVDIKGKRADVTLQQTAGNCSLQTEYGSVHFYTDTQSGNVRITAQMTDITLSGLEANSHNYRLKTRFGNLEVPDKFDKSGSTDKERTAVYQVKPDSPSIEVETSFGHIKVEK
ncbi:MAG TPA: DUF4097 family beta strand repeat-containing protein [Saprospiraceae bacterium]|nr:DUF4097 family beta strand repeat-containing protein [Saprospiraceae bacterium]